jgi:hypothetical protein
MYKKLRFLLLVILIPTQAWADCLFKIGEWECVRVKIVEAKLGNYHASGFSDPTDTRPKCQVEFEEYKTGKREKFVTKECPQFKGFEYVSIARVCNDLGGVPPGLDSIRFAKKEECVEHDRQWNLRRAEWQAQKKNQMKVSKKP